MMCGQARFLGVHLRAVTRTALARIGLVVADLVAQHTHQMIEHGLC